MSKRSKKKEKQVTKVAAETGVDPKDLARLPQDALQKLDELKPDDGDLLGDSNDSGDEESDNAGSGESDDLSSDEDHLATTESGTIGRPVDATTIPSGTQVGNETSGTTTLGGPDSAGQSLPSDSELGGSEEDSEASLPDTGTAVSSETGTQVVGEVAGGEMRPLETPQQSDEVETEEGQGSSEGTISSGTRTDDVVKEHVIIGYHPVTEEPVYADEQ